jgi:hypothetical protein
LKKHYPKRTGTSSYQFWYSALAKMREYAKKDPDVELKIGRTSKKDNILEAMKSPEGEEIVILSSKISSAKLTDSKSTHVKNEPIHYPFPSEAPVDPNNLRFTGERERYIRAFVPPQVGSADPHNANYLMSAGLGQVLVDLNDPAVLQMRKDSNLIQTLLATINDPPLVTATASEIKNGLDSSPKSGPHYMIGGGLYNIGILRHIISVFENGNLNFYQVKELDPENPPLAVSDGEGHFILTVAATGKRM